jgi:hypothetical protein
VAREESFFDELARGLADGSVTRGKALRLMGAALLGGTLASLGIGEAAADPPGCKRLGKNCTRDTQCCGSLVCPSGTCQTQTTTTSSTTSSTTSTSTSTSTSTTTTAGPVCTPTGGAGPNCGTCGPNGECLCVQTTEGHIVCVQDLVFSGSCTDSGDCLTSGACFIDCNGNQGCANPRLC